ncbi:MAG: hypothetical protein JST51_16310 [Armatimonadetes bacterium]|nr:hypothetical protein [Armatimonadota bacterium]
MPKTDETFVKSLAKALNPAAVVRVETSTDDKETWTFLDCKAKTLASLEVPEDCRDIRMSPDGTMARATLEKYNFDTKRTTGEFLVVDHTGQIASHHFDDYCVASWFGKGIVYVGTKQPLTRWAPSEGTWKESPISDITTNEMTVDGDTLWLSKWDPKARLHTIIHLDSNGKRLQAIPTDEFQRDIIATYPEKSLLVIRMLTTGGDGLGPLSHLVVFNTDSGHQQLVDDHMDGGYTWHPQVGILGFVTRPSAGNGQLALLSMKTGRTISVGPNDLNLATCAELDDRTALVGDWDGRLFTVDVLTHTIRKLDLGLGKQMLAVSRCR